MVKIGEEVIAVQSLEKGHLKVFGKGIYKGDHVPDKDPFNEAGIKNPCIELEDGSYVWGFECWWGSREGFAKQYDSIIKSRETVKPQGVKPVKPISDD